MSRKTLSPEIEQLAPGKMMLGRRLFSFWGLAKVSWAFPVKLPVIFYRCWVVVSNYFAISSPILGEMIQLDEHIFEMG